jgi:predicted SprT family Zn-dependent metalloprotease
MIGVKAHDRKSTYDRYLCIKCGEDYLSHQTIIEDSRGRCLCLNCWEQLKRVVIK